MTESAANYNDLVTAWGVEKIRTRFVLIFSAAEAFLDRHALSDQRLKEYFFISELAITEAVLDYFSDIMRLKLFHQIDKVEPEKVAAYTAYWVWRRKPLQLIGQPGDDILKKFPFVRHFNESFAVALMISMVFNTAKIIHHDGWSRYNRFSYLLNYFFSYRAVNPQAFELILYALAVRPIYERLC
jgi:hypothetical protein